ncbi:substrate-binding domain-containing protein [Frankia sp. Cj5]|uniref:sugar ABC transporter substrate-binding protein n=1 Tax=Frankia sp. Cj5 TaxID=2880978 RepID=UPI001EF42011|nr:substrate-binding domain-containing protein [Frankia sp. Cj5]
MPLVVGAALALVLAACADNAGSTAPATGQTPASDTSLAAAKANLANYLTQPTSIVQSTPLKSAPPKKKVAFVQCADPNCAILAGFVKDATAALGWNLTTLSATATDPGSAVQQAIDAGVDYIATTGYPVDLFKQQMNQAKSKGIPLFMCYSTDVPAGPGNNLYADCTDGSAAGITGGAIADFVATDSNGKADVLLVTIPSYPILTAQADGMRAELAKNCPTCKVHVLETTVNDLAGGAVPQNISSYLQANPGVNYVYFTYNGLEKGVPAVLKTAGMLGKVKLVGTQGAQPQFTEVVNGTSAAWSALPQELAMWTMVDQMARVAVDQWSLPDERKAAVTPFYLVTTPDQAKPLVDEKYGWPGPTGFKDTFKKLWGL